MFGQRYRFSRNQSKAANLFYEDHDSEDLLKWDQAIKVRKSCQLPTFAATQTA